MKKWTVLIVGTLVFLGIAHYFTESANIEFEEENNSYIHYRLPPISFPEGTKFYTQSDIDNMENVEIKLVFKINSSYKDCFIDWIADGSWLENVTFNCPDDYFEIDHFEMGELWDIRP